MPQESVRPAIFCETGDNESLLIGTRSQLTAFAERILQLANASVESKNWHGIIVSLPTCAPSLTDTRSEVVLDGVVVVDTENDRRSLINKVRANNELDPVDWEE